MSVLRFWRGRLPGGLLRSRPPKSIDTVGLAPFVAERDAGLLREWLRAPHVARWWGDPSCALEYVLGSPDAGGHMLVKAGSKPVGYVRWKAPPRQAFDAVGMTEIPDGTIDIDILIGDPQNTGRGIGTAALRMLVNRLASPPEPPLMMICSSIANAGAIRAYEKAGFQRIRTFDDPAFGEMWLLTLLPERRAAAQ